MIYFIITTSLIPYLFEDRKTQYIYAISKILEKTKLLSLDLKCIIVENNGYRETFLNDIGIDVLYTTTNHLPLEKGTKETYDILACIREFKMRESDFIVKITGRYILEDTCPFLEELKNIDHIDAIVRYDSFMHPASKVKTKDCITGLIGIRVKHFFKMEIPLPNEVIEWKWANICNDIEDERIRIMDNLGISICPGGMQYFSV
jgi:hypothetical protein